MHQCAFFSFEDFEVKGFSARNGFLARNGFSARNGLFLPEMAFFCQKWLFGSNGCSEETAFQPKIFFQI